MGTNYYAVRQSCPNPCKHCGAEELVHIGKGLVMFRGYPVNPFDDDGQPLLTWRHWRNTLRTDVTEIEDEYGNRVNVDEFIATVEKTSRESRERQYRWMVEHESAYSGNDWMDAEGFSFTYGEFS